jgi:D-glycero-D-manno-heptose 1,7-bisphosphate phosphatase
MNKAVFFDRDGVINNEESNYYIHKRDDFKLNDGIVHAMKVLQDNGFLLIVITNQGGISKGFYTGDDVKAVHQKMISELRSKAIELTEIYYCPHHSDNENCLCRKPKSLLLEKAIARFNIDTNQSFFIGDRETDRKAGEKVGLKTILVKANSDMSVIPSLIGI